MEDSAMEMEEEASENPNWMDLPTEIWIRILKYLKIKDLKNVHLISKKFHEIAVNHVPRKLKLNLYSIHLIQQIPVAMRMYDDVEISEEFLIEEFANVFEEILRNCGVHIKKFKVSRGEILNQSKFLELLNMLPNLHHLILSDLDFADETDSFEGKIILPRLKILEIENCESTVEDFIIRNLENRFSLSELNISTDAILKFLPLLKNHEKSVKKLTLGFENKPDDLLKILSSLGELELEHLDIYNSFNCNLKTNDEKFLNFLRQHSNLKYLKLTNTILHDTALNVICDALKNLETLDITNNCRLIMSGQISINSTINLHKLTKLKKLTFQIDFLHFNHLNGLANSVNENLEELRANFENVSGKFMLKLPKFIPNLKKLVIEKNFRPNLDVLKLFPNLEHVEVKVSWERNRYHINPTLYKKVGDKITSNLKYLKIARTGWPLTVENSWKLVYDFPNLEHLSISRPSGFSDDSVEILLKGLQKLKHFNIFRNENTLSEKSIISFKMYGKNLEQFQIWNVDCHMEFAENELQNFKELRVLEKDQGKVLHWQI